MKRAIILIILALMMVRYTSALGVAPSSVEITFESNQTKSVQLKIINNEHTRFQAVVYPETELTPYVTIDQPVLEFSPEDEYKIVTYRLSLPDDFERQGLHESKIIVRTLPSEKGMELTGAQALIAVVSKIKLNVPYHGKYIEIHPIIFSAYEANKSSSFFVEVKNLGTEEIFDLRVAVDVYTPLNVKVHTFTGGSRKLGIKENAIVDVPWRASLNPGSYLAVVNVMYDGKTVTADFPFKIGEFSLRVSSISVEDFRLGGIARLRLLIENNWNQEIEDVYAELRIQDQNNRTVAETKTASANVPSIGRQELSAYWDTMELLPGRYTADINLHAPDYTTQQIFNLILKEKEIRAVPVGAVLEEAEGVPINTMIKGLAALTLAMLLLNVFLILKQRTRRAEETRKEEKAGTREETKNKKRLKAEEKITPREEKKRGMDGRAPQAVRKKKRCKRTHAKTSSYSKK